MEGWTRQLTAAAAVVLLGAAPAPPSPVTAAQPGYDLYVVGDLTAAVPGPVAPGLLLNGGGAWPPTAFRWFAARAGHGHLVVLRASGEGEVGEQMYREVGGLASVETFVFRDRRAASDPRVLAAVARADGIFIAGGDQSRYVRFWRDTPLARALDRHVAAGRPLGGTSAGLAIMGSTAYGALDGGSIGSAAALRDPLGLGVTLVSGLLHLAALDHLVTDSHFGVRDRLGRLIAFVAKARWAGDLAAVGLGIDESSALCVDGEGIATFHGGTGSFAWLVRPEGALRVRRGFPLDGATVRVTGIGPSSRFDLRSLVVERPAFTSVVQVRQGRLSTR